MSKEPSILIPNYNGARFIAKTLQQFQEAFEGHITMVVDDASTDNSLEILKPFNSKIISKTTNGGFASSVNRGLKELIKEAENVILVANSDLEIEKGDAQKIRKIIQQYDKNPKLGIIGFIESKNSQIHSGVDISGFCFLIHKKVIQKIGYLDETFFMYGEEQDYFRRVVENGFEIEQSNIVIKHETEGSGGCKKRNSWLAIRNSIYLEAKRMNITATLKKIIVLFLIINRLYPRGEVTDPSLTRVRRPGILIGNYYLLKAILWNIKRAII